MKVMTLQKIRSVIMTLPLKFSGKLLEYEYNKVIENKLLHSIDKIHTHLTRREKLKLYQLASQKHGVFVEIGSYLGVSSCFIAEGIKQSGKQSILYCIDTWQNDAMSDGKKETYQEFIEVTKKYQEIIIPLKGWSYDVAKSFDKKIDFLFIDGDHSYKGVKKDVDLWVPKLSSGALVVMHDIGWAEGVQLVVKEYIAPIAKRDGRLPNLYWAWI
jgi:predicted O-methyltransferase YrrM